MLETHKMKFKKGILKSNFRSEILFPKFISDLKICISDLNFFIQFLIQIWIEVFQIWESTNVRNKEFQILQRKSPGYGIERSEQLLTNYFSTTLLFSSE